MQLTDRLARTARRQVHSAALLTTLLALLSLVLGLRAWHERRHLDLELLVGLVDSCVVVALAYALSRQIRLAGWALLALGALGAAYTLWSGAPAVAILPQVVSGILTARAVAALRFLKQTRPDVPA